MRRHVFTVATALILAAGASGASGAFGTVPASGQELTDAQSRREAVTLYRSGLEFMTAERFDRAAELFTESTKKDPLFSVAHYQLGQAYMNLRRFTSAILAYNGAIEAMRKLHGLEQTSKFEVDKRREEEIRELRVELNVPGATNPITQTALEQRLHDLERQRKAPAESFQAPAFVLLALGSAQFRNGDAAAAELNWKAAVDADPKYGEAHNNLAVIYMQTGRIAEAEREVALAERNGFRVNPRFKDDLRARR